MHAYLLTYLLTHILSCLLTYRAYLLTYIVTYLLTYLGHTDRRNDRSIHSFETLRHDKQRDIINVTRATYTTHLPTDSLTRPITSVRHPVRSNQVAMVTDDSCCRCCC